MVADHVRFCGFAVFGAQLLAVVQHLFLYDLSFIYEKLRLRSIGAKCL
jgi:hypothetical protein